MILPPPLRRGDVVRVVAPAGPFDAERFERGLEVLRSRLGLVPRFRGDVTARDGYLAGSDTRRLEEWHEAASDPEARAVWCARGGYGSMRLLPRLEAARMLHPPKWFIGFSDLTAMHLALQQAGLATVHGPMVVQLGRTTPESLDQLEALLFALRPPARGDGPAFGAGVVGSGVVRAGRASGPLMGGSLAILAHLCGTRWQPRLAGAILFLEDVGEEAYRLDRYLTQLRLAGALDGVAGVVVGELVDCDRPGQPLGQEVVRRMVRELDVPAIDGVPAGHEAANLALPLGAVVTLIAPEPGEPGPPRVIFGQGPSAP